MNKNLIEYWLKNLLDIEIDYNQLRKDHVGVVNLITDIFKKYELLNKDIQRAIRNATTIEHKLSILQPYLKSFGIKIDARTISCIKCGNIEKLKEILTQMYMVLSPNPCYKYKNLRSYQEKVCVDGPNKKFSKFKVTVPVLENEKHKSIDKELEYEGKHVIQMMRHSKAQQKKLCKELKDRYSEQSFGTNPSRHSLNLDKSCSNHRNPLQQHLLEFDSCFVDTNHSQMNFHELLQLQEYASLMPTEDWNPCKYKMLKESLAQKRKIKNRIVSETKNKILNAVWDVIEETPVKNEATRRRRVLHEDTATERDMKQKLKARAELCRLENEHAIEMENQANEARIKEYENQLKTKAKYAFLRQRRVLEEHYNVLKSEYNKTRKEESNGLQKLFNSIIETGICLAINYSSNVPENILSENTCLVMNDLPMYDTPVDLKSPKAIELDKESEKFIINLHKRQYLCSQGPWKNVQINKTSLMVEKIINSFKRLTNPSVSTNIESSAFPIRVVLCSNMIGTDKNEFIKMLKEALDDSGMEIIEPDSLFKNALSELCLTKNIDDDGLCELINDSLETLSNVSSDIDETSIKNGGKPKLKKKSSMNTSGKVRKSTSRKSVTISNITEVHQNDDQEVQIKHETHICQTPSTWVTEQNSHLLSYMQIMSSVIEKYQSFKQLPLKMKIEFIVRHFEDLSLKMLKGLILIDFPSTLEEIEALEQTLVGVAPSLIKYNFYQSEHEFESGTQHHKSFFTHYIRLKNVSELHLGLHCDEINCEEFEMIKEFYLSLGAYHTLEYNDMTKVIKRTIELLKENISDATSIETNKQHPVKFIRTHVSLRKAHVELQTEPDDVIIDNNSDESQTVDQYIETWRDGLSQFFAEEKVNKWNCIRMKYEDSVTKPLFIRSNVLRDYHCFKRYVETTFNDQIKQVINDTNILKTFQYNFNELDIFYRKDEDGKCYLYALIDDLVKELTNLTQIKRSRNVKLLKSVYKDPIINNMTALINNCSKWLMFCECQRFINTVRFIIELFSFLLRQEIMIDIPEMQPPKDVDLVKTVESISKSNLSIEDIKDSSVSKQSLTEENLKSDVSKFSSHGMTQYIEAKNEVQSKLDSYLSMIDDVTSQINDNLEPKPSSISISSNSRASKPASLKTKRSRMSDTSSVTSKRTSKTRKGKSIETISSRKSRSRSTINSGPTDSLEVETLKHQLRSCIEEQRVVTKEAFDKIIKGLETDLFSTVLDNGRILKDIHHRIQEREKQEFDQIRCLCENLSYAIENTWESIEICKCNGNYFVDGTPFISPVPSLESLSSDQRLFNQLSDIKSLITEFHTTNTYHISYHNAIQILRTFLITQYFNNTDNQLCSSMESIQRILHQLKQKVSDNGIIVDWRDIVLNLIGVVVRQPTLVELLEMKRMFEEKSVVKSCKWVSVGNYCQIKLWVEFIYDIEIACELKAIYFELFKRGESGFDYENFLLALCKSKNPVEGFHRALELFLGQSINASHEMEEELLVALKDEKKFKQFIRQEMKELIRNICCKILNSDDFPWQKDSSLIHSESWIMNKPHSFDSVENPPDDEFSLSKLEPNNRPSHESILIKAHEKYNLLARDCNENLTKTKQTPVERYLHLRKLHSCGCPSKGIDFDCLTKLRAFNDGSVYFINKSLVKHVLERAFPWHQDYKSDGYDLLDGINFIFHDLHQEFYDILPNSDIPVHKILLHDFIQHWINKGLTFRSDAFSQN